MITQISKSARLRKIDNMNWNTIEDSFIGIHQAIKMPSSMRKECEDSDQYADAQIIIRAYALHSYIL